jgi:hypothetical protein
MISFARLRHWIVMHRSLKRTATALLSSRLVVKNPLYRFLYARRIAAKIAAATKPDCVRVENTAFCNAECRFCPHADMRRAKGLMEDSLYEKIIREMKDAGIAHLSLHGFGEPFLDKKLSARVALAKGAGIALVTTNSNGSLADEERARELVSAGLDEIYISLDAATAETLSVVRPKLDFARIEANIRGLCRLRKKNGCPKVYLSFVECPENSGEIRAYLKKWGGVVDGISVSTLHNWGGNKGVAEKGNTLRDPCRLLWSDLNVLWDGRVSICCNDHEGAEIVGDLNRNTLMEVWNGERLKRVREIHAGRCFDEIGVCAECSYNRHNKSPWWL